MTRTRNSELEGGGKGAIRQGRMEYAKLVKVTKWG